MFYLQLTIGLEMEKVAEVVSVTFFYAPTSSYFFRSLTNLVVKLKLKLKTTNGSVDFNFDLTQIRDL